MKKLMKVLCLVLVLMVVVAPVTSLAKNIDFTPYTQQGTNNQAVNAVQNVSGTVFNILQAVGMGVAVCMIIYMGIQWLLATPAKKAELKGRMFSMVIGIVLLFGGVAILNVVQKASTDFSTTLNQ